MSVHGSLTGARGRSSSRRLAGLLVALLLATLLSVVAAARQAEAADPPLLKLTGQTGYSGPAYCSGIASNTATALDRYAACIRTPFIFDYRRLTTFPKGISNEVQVDAYTWGVFDKASPQIIYGTSFKVTAFREPSATWSLGVAPACGVSTPASGSSPKGTCTGTSTATAQGLTTLELNKWYSFSWTERYTLNAGVQWADVFDISKPGLSFQLARNGVLDESGTGQRRTFTPNFGSHCDTLYGTAGGCASTIFNAIVKYDATKTPKVDAVARHIVDAQAAGKPGAPGGTPITRGDPKDDTTRRNQVCFSGAVATDDYNNTCDEYPMASTLEGGTGASVRAVPKESNDSQGGTTGTFYSGQRVVPGDKFWVQATPSGATSSSPNRILAVGDSISQGFEGDYTWRYRLDTYLSDNDVVHDMVGPWTGTNHLDPAYPAGWPDVQTPPHHDGAYRSGVFFDKDDMAEWGWTMTEAKDAINAQVRAYDPSGVLVELGFNDIAWGVNNADGTVAAAKTLIDQARLAKQAVAGNTNIKIAIANVVQRTPLENYTALPGMISSYNTKLAQAISGWSTSASPVVMVDINSVYSASTDAYDGLHPNAIGEWKIAKGFSKALASTAFGTIVPEIPAAKVPASPSLLPITTAPNFTLTPLADGIQLKWGHVFGASGYWITSKDQNDPWSAKTRLPLPIGAETWKATGLLRGHSYAYTVTTARGNAEAPETAQLSATAVVETAEGPSVYTVTPQATSIRVQWNVPSGDYTSTITGYKIYVVDSNNKVTTITTSLRDYTISNLTPGQNYALGIASINHAGEGRLAPIHGAVVGRGTPSTPTLSSATYQVGVGQDQINLGWTRDSGTSAYWLYSRDLNASGPYQRAPWPITSPISLATASGANHWSFCIVATNGTLSSPVPTSATTPANASYCKTPTLAAALQKAAAVDVQPAQQEDPRIQYWTTLARLPQNDPTAAAPVRPMTQVPPPVVPSAETGK